MWKQINLYGSLSISRVVSEYRIHHAGVPTTGYRIKVYELRDKFFAFPNLKIRTPDGSVDGTCGLGATEMEALQDAVNRVSELLATRPRWQESDFEWSDPHDF